MTTIAYDGKTLAADSQTTTMPSGAIMPGSEKKIHRFGDVRFGCAGSAALCQAFVEEIMGSSPANFSYSKELLKETYVKVLEEHRKFMSNEKAIDKSQFAVIAIYDEFPDVVVQISPSGTTSLSTPCAIGSGGKYALAGMLMGLNAKKAVKLARKMDAFTGGKIITLGSNKDELE